MNSLKSLSDKALVQQLHRIVRQEKQLTLEVLSHLAEVARRELYLAKGYSTLSDYCLCELGYGESSACRRVRVARVIKDVPQVYDLMNSGELSFSAVLQVAGVLHPQNQKTLLPRLAGKSRSEIERIVAEYQMPVAIRDQAKPRIVRREVTVDRAPAGASAKSAGGRRATAAGVNDNEADNDARLGEISLHCEGKNDPGDEGSTPKKIVYEKMYEVRFAADEELMELIKWMRSHLSHRIPNGASYQDIFKYAMHYVRDREDLTKRAERREQREKQQKRTSNSEILTNGRRDIPSRHIPTKEKEKVWVRDGGRCTYKGPNGRRCNSDHNLQFDHYPIPFARGGRGTADNLRLLCARHNRFSAEQVYGKTHMERYHARE
jgi:5-methylcytosine-specific restriction endonuclease McrA